MQHEAEGRQGEAGDQGSSRQAVSEQVCAVAEDEEHGSMSAVEALGRAAVQSVREFQVCIAQLASPCGPIG